MTCVCVWECVFVCWEDCGSPWALWRLSLRFWQLRGIRKQGWGFSLSQVLNVCEDAAAPRVLLLFCQFSCSCFASEREEIVSESAESSLVCVSVTPQVHPLKSEKGRMCNKTGWSRAFYFWKGGGGVLSGRSKWRDAGKIRRRHATKCPEPGLNPGESH